MIDYYKLEQRNPSNSEQTRIVYKVKSSRTISGDEFIDTLASHTGLSTATIKGVLTGVAYELATLLGQGHSVNLPDIGTFSIGIRLDEERKKQLDAEQKAAQQAEDEGVEAQKVSDPNALSLKLRHINFRKDRKLFKEVAGNLKVSGFRRIYGKEGRKISIDDTTQEARIQAAREYLATHAFMRIDDYASMTGLSRSSAHRELQSLVDDDASGITTQGRGTHRVYVLK